MTLRDYVKSQLRLKTGTFDDDVDVLILSCNSYLTAAGIPATYNLEPGDNIDTVLDNRYLTIQSLNARTNFSLNEDDEPNEYSNVFHSHVNQLRLSAVVV